jgi:hypothetical protein
MNRYNNHSVLATINSTPFCLPLYEKKYQATVILIKNSINIYSWKILYFRYFLKKILFFRRTEFYTNPYIFKNS